MQMASIMAESKTASTRVMVLRTRNSIYVVTHNGQAHESRVTCVTGTYAGTSYVYDVEKSEPITMGQPMVFRGCMPVDPSDTRTDGVIVTTDLLDLTHA